MTSRMRGMWNARRIAGRFIAADGGATAIEYALIASGVGATIAAVIFGLGTGITTNLYSRIAALL